MSGGDGNPDTKGFIHRLKRGFRLRISTKILIYFLFVALIPMAVVSYTFSNAAREQMLENASSKQQAVATDLARRIDNYLASRINMLSYIGRLYSTRDFSVEQVNTSMAALFSQNNTLQQVSVMSPKGEIGSGRTYTMENGNLKTADDDVSIGPGVLDVIANKPYFLSVGRDSENKPQITIGVLVLKKYKDAGDDLITAQQSSSDNLIGALLGYYDASDLWESVMSGRSGDKGYAYVVDNVGNLVAHPDKAFLASHTQLRDTEAVRQFLDNNSETKQTVSETNQDVVSTSKETLTKWGVIVEEPVSSIYAGINAYVQLAITVGISALILSIALGLFFSRRLIRPIKALSLGAKRMEEGKFDQEINVRTQDELQELAETFNNMARGIKKLISELKTNNVRLKFEQIKLNNIISSVSNGVIAVSSDGKIVSINPPAATLIGKDPKSLEGTLMSEQFPWEHDGERFMPDLKNGGIYRYTDLTLNRRGGSVAYLDIMVAVLTRQDSDVAAIITIHDQTPSRELSFMKLDFVAIAAHELRTPLTVVRGYLDMLSTGSAVSELSIYNLENLSKAIDGADQLRALINKLLNIARIERGDMEIFIEKLNLTKLVRENVEHHVSAAAAKEQTISYNANTDGTVYVPADSASILEVVNNLVGNAIKYTGKGGKIKVNLLVDKDKVRVEVIDNGPGVPEELRDRLFTKFYRAERSLIAGTRGTGLGLFISKTIIELQNGEIGIEPDKGTGSTFYFTLPIYVPARDDEIIAKKTSGGIRGWFKKRPSS